jgi:hypothetical protein
MNSSNLDVTLDLSAIVINSQAQPNIESSYLYT